MDLLQIHYYALYSEKYQGATEHQINHITKYNIQMHL